MTGTRILPCADRLLDGEGWVVGKGAVPISGNRVEAVGRQADFGLPDGAGTIKARGPVLPGMCDVHLRSPCRAGEGAAEALERAHMSSAEIALRPVVV